MPGDADTLTARDWLVCWERGSAGDASLRPLRLLEAALPSSSADELAGLPLGERDALLLELRQALFGAALPCFTNCPACDAPLEFDAATTQLRAAPTGEGVPLEVESAGHRVRFRRINTLDQQALGRCDSADAACRLLLERCILEAARDGEPCAVETLPAEVIEALEEAMSRADPRAVSTLALSCPACAHAWQADLDIARYLWSELDHWARRRLREVHELARAYGWSEAEILAMTAFRRRQYLELAAA
ncbi:MAG TPA: hypothetical protein VEC59_10265 [Steroidobacteraceae bacterium]|nr:hypothetical protein [Steroidobacteraceae bacterium]